jgi:hypothetical protein
MLKSDTVFVYRVVLGRRRRRALQSTKKKKGKKVKFASYTIMILDGCGFDNNIRRANLRPGETRKSMKSKIAYFMS